MKKTILTSLILVVFLLSLASCVPVVSQEEYDTLRGNLDDARREVDDLTENLTALQDDYNDLQADYEYLSDGLEQSMLKNPMWAELKDFLEHDDTDTMIYVESSFDCTGFAITLRDQAWRRGFRCAYIEVGFSEVVGHALNAFETVDQGLIYVDSTKADQIAYVKINQLYGTIHLNGVKPEYIACSENPAEFWTSLTYSSHPAIFSYDYYIDYKRRWEFYQESVEAYNKAVDEYNRGSGEWSYSQLTTWLDNLGALGEDLGSIFFEPADAVKSIETYWN